MKESPKVSTSFTDSLIHSFINCLTVGWIEFPSRSTAVIATTSGAADTARKETSPGRISEVQRPLLFNCNSQRHDFGVPVGCHSMVTLEPVCSSRACKEGLAGWVEPSQGVAGTRAGSE